MDRIIELLNTAYKILQMDKGDEYRYNVAIPLKEAIAGLEAHRSCKGCKRAHDTYNLQPKYKYDELCKSCYRYADDNYEPKDN